MPVRAVIRASVCRMLRVVCKSVTASVRVIQLTRVSSTDTSSDTLGPPLYTPLSGATSV